MTTRTHPTADHGQTPVSAQRAHGPAAFLIICFAWSWTSLGIAHLAGFDLSHVGVQLATVALVPAASAVVVRLWVTREGFGDSGLRPRLRQQWRSYLAALLIPVGVLVLGLALAATTGVWSPAGGIPVTDLVTTVTAGPLVALAGAMLFLGEELGWTAYLRDRLLPGRPVATTFATGLIWGVWHFPLPWVGYFGGAISVTDATVAMLLWLPLSILLEFLIGWLWAQAGSVWPAALLHAGCNLVAAVGLEQAFQKQVSQTTSTLIYCVALVPFMLGVVLTGHLGRTERAPVAQP